MQNVLLVDTTAQVSVDPDNPRPSLLQVIELAALVSQWEVRSTDHPGYGSTTSIPAQREGGTKSCITT